MKKLKRLPLSPARLTPQAWIGVLAGGIVGAYFLIIRFLFPSVYQKDFEHMLNQNAVSEVVLITNQNLVEVSLKPTHIKAYEYLGIRDWPIWGASGPHCQFKVLNAEQFNRDYQQLLSRAADSKAVPLQIVERNSLADTWAKFGSGILMVLVLIVVYRQSSLPAAKPGTSPAGKELGKSIANLIDTTAAQTVYFKDVAGQNEAKEEIQEIVEFLRNPARFTHLGGRIPKGVLLVGPPGTGKTLLARAVAGEAGVPFFSLSGSDFVEIFVGVGAARVRDLFTQAQQKAPCIIFIDEIDAIGKARSQSLGAGSGDEREGTLNALLVAIDGFASDQGIIVMAATNRVDILDSALLRPGRFDRQVYIGKPDASGREDIFRVHLKKIKTDGQLDYRYLAALTPGSTGAEIANICNEAALIGARRNHAYVELDDMQSAIDRVANGIEYKNRLVSPQERRITAYHEAGHVVVSWLLEYTSPLVKVSIIPRGASSLGYTQYLPKEQQLKHREEFIDDLCMIMGGRAAEELIFNRLTTTASSDIERITRIAYTMITVHGMSTRIGNLSFSEARKQQGYSQATADLIDEEVKLLVEEVYQRTNQILRHNQQALNLVAEALLEREVLYASDIQQLLGKRAGSTLEALSLP